MANNIMYLKCDKCGEKTELMRYYPSTRWYSCAERHSFARAETFTGNHLHGDSITFGPTHFSLEFEEK
jgi:hypothetical protein